jgi:biotin-(acetyl-CoA carboxylase) ligase
VADATPEIGTGIDDEGALVLARRGWKSHRFRAGEVTLEKPARGSG